ncbi:hypothetical protein [Ruegeria sp. THAF57]|uniref:hypothetical protein n=1 Tax=Ruegeria sp. THAF57 TaxID=2744555 RepID=UPI0015DE62A2|nr:hypothetical protein [Ruegeria sp. THAF57]
MREEYDKPLHSPLPWKSMESQGQALDEAKIDTVIADLLSEEASPRAVEPEIARPAETAELDAEDERAEDSSETVIGFTSALRQKWAELVGAA